MTDIDDILGRSSKEETMSIDIDGICEECYWSLDHGFYSEKSKKLTIVCVNNHERTIDWDMDA